MRERLISCGLRDLRSCPACIETRRDIFRFPASIDNVVGVRVPGAPLDYGSPPAQNTEPAGALFAQMHRNIELDHVPSSGLVSDDHVARREARPDCACAAYQHGGPSRDERKPRSRSKLHRDDTPRSELDSRAVQILRRIGSILGKHGPRPSLIRVAIWSGPVFRQIEGPTDTINSDHTAAPASSNPRV